MPTKKLTTTQRNDIIKRVGSGADVILLAKQYGVSKTYIRKLYLDTKEVVLEETGIPTNYSKLVTLKNPKGYEIGRYKNGSPIIAYTGEKIEPHLTFHNPTIIVIDRTPEGNPIYAYIGAAAARAVDEFKYRTGKGFAIAESGEGIDENDLIVE